MLKLRHVVQVLLLVVLVFVWRTVLIWATSSWQHSHYFQPDVQVMQRASRDRELAANATLAQFAHREPVEVLGRGLDTCLVVMSAPRPVSYIGSLLASLIHALNASYPDCLAKKGSNRKKEGDTCPVQVMLFDTSNGRNIALQGVVERVAPVIPCRECAMPLDWQDSQILHYALALNFSASRGCGSVLLMEDDIVVSRDLFERLSLTAAKFDRERWVLVKLFQTDFWGNWEREFADIFTLLSVPLLCSLAILFAARRLCGVRLTRARHGALLLLATAGGAWTMWVIGKQYFISQRPRPFQEGDCSGSLANFYPRDMVIALGAFLSRSSGKPVDLLLCDFAQSMRRQVVVYAGGVQHIGLVSSSPDKQVRRRVAAHKLDPDFRDPSFQWTWG